MGEVRRDWGGGEAVVAEAVIGTPVSAGQGLATQFPCHPDMSQVGISCKEVLT